MSQFDISFETMNRTAVVVVPKQPFVDWLNHIPDPEFKFDGKDYTLDAMREHATVYLIPDFDETPEMEEFFKKIKPSVFEEQLQGWYGDQNTWPKLRTAKVFDLWFDAIIDCMVFDTLDRESIIKDSD